MRNTPTRNSSRSQEQSSSTSPIRTTKRVQLCTERTRLYRHNERNERWRMAQSTRDTQNNESHNQYNIRQNSETNRKGNNRETHGPAEYKIPSRASMVQTEKSDSQTVTYAQQAHDLTIWTCKICGEEFEKESELLEWEIHKLNHSLIAFHHNLNRQLAILINTLKPSGEKNVST